MSGTITRGSFSAFPFADPAKMVVVDDVVIKGRQCGRCVSPFVVFCSLSPIFRSGSICFLAESVSVQELIFDCIST